MECGVVEDILSWPSQQKTTLKIQSNYMEILLRVTLLCNSSRLDSNPEW